MIPRVETLGSGLSMCTGPESFCVEAADLGAVMSMGLKIMVSPAKQRPLAWRVMNHGRWIGMEDILSECFEVGIDALSLQVC